MTDVRTLKQGHLHVLAGAAEPVASDTGVSYPTGFVASDGTHVLLYAKNGDIYRVAGNSFLSLATGAGSVVIGEAQTIVRPVVHVSGSTVHLWYGYDSAGGSARTVYYAKSTNAGATWTSGVEVIALGSGGTWNDVFIWPIGAHDDGTNLVLHCEAYDGVAQSKLGVFTATSGADYALSGSYSASGSNPISGYVTQYNSVVHHRGAYHWFNNSSNPSFKSVAYSQSADGITWNPALPDRTTPVWDVGASGSKDDAHAIVYGGWSDNRVLWMFYNGGDGVTLRNFVAVGEQADKLYKVAGLRVTSLPSEIPYCTGDLSWQEKNRAQHITDRNKAGALTEAMFEPFDGSFGYRMTTAPDSYVTPSPGVNGDAQTVNLLYLLEDSAGASEQWVLFPRALCAWDFSEAAEGDMVNVSFTCHGTMAPIQGEY